MCITCGIAGYLCFGSKVQSIHLCSIIAATQRIWLCSSAYQISTRSPLSVHPIVHSITIVRAPHSPHPTGNN
jgi:hypothetical protein